MSAVHLEIENGIATLRLDNPARLNAFTPDMLGQLAGHCETLDRDDSVRCVLLTAEGERAFCAGADITAWAGNGIHFVVADLPADLLLELADGV